MQEAKAVTAEQVFFASDQDVRSMLATAADLCEKGTRLYGAALINSTSLPAQLQKLVEGRGRLRGFSVSGNSPYLIEAPRRDQDGQKVASVRAFIWQAEGTDICFFLTCQSREDFEFLFEQVHSFLQPEVCRIYLRSTQIEQTLKTVATDHPSLKIRVSRYVARKWRESRVKAGQVDTSVEYCDEDYAAVFQKLETEGKWLQSLALNTAGFRTCSGRLARDSTFSCTSGFEFFFQQFVGTVAKQVLTLRDLFRNRSRIDSPTKASKPLKIVYKTGIFADRKNNYRLIGVLENLSNSALSVFHPNPYLHASLIDYADGSSYSILVSTSTGILISPERKATTQSLARLCEYICDNFEEGDVVEFTPHESR